MGRNALTRREFIKKSAATGVALAASSVGGFASANVLGANERINIGIIGTGGRATSILRELMHMSTLPEHNLKVVAVCDVDRVRLQRAVGIALCKPFHDYRELLAMQDLDAVVIGTPDHWHATMTIDAMKAGKDVYCEKPMTLTWQEAKEVARVAKETGAVVQIGAQSASDGIWWTAGELIRDGVLGKVVWTQSSICRNSVAGEWNYPYRENFREEDVDWDMWLGPAPKRPFDIDRFFRWRKYWDYSGGVSTDLFYHQLSHLAIALGPEFPMRVTSGGGIWVQKDREVPDTIHTVIDYPSEHTVVLMSSMANDVGVEEIIRGHEATMYFRGNQEVVVVPQAQFAGRRKELRVEAKQLPGHMENWLQCIRSRSQCTLNPETAYRVMVAIALSVESYRKKRVMEFDPARERVIA